MPCRPAPTAVCTPRPQPDADAVRTLRDLCLIHLDGFAEGEGAMGFAEQKDLGPAIVRSVLQMAAAAAPQGPVC
ncbi:MAG: hypothetical protein JWQ37_1708 [Blastococcus sp.]|nr:hypothetical protein [Blastococcus sp.]